MRERGRRDKRGLADATLIGGEVKLAVTHRSRLVGLLENPDELSPLLIAPCRDVHTFGMRVSLDIAFLDANGVVMRVSRDVGRWRRIRCPGASMVVERVARKGPWLQEGDKVGLRMAGSAFPHGERR